MVHWFTIQICERGGMYQGLVVIIILHNRTGGYGSRNLLLLGHARVHLHVLQALGEVVPGPHKGLGIQVGLLSCHCSLYMKTR